MKYFSTSGIRGVYGEKVTEELALRVGKAFGSYVPKRSVAVARDSRNSGPSLRDSLVDGLLSTGCSIVDLGIVPTPLLAFGTKHFGCGGGVMITASHNPSQYNGFKTWDKSGRSDTIKEEEEIELIMDSGRFHEGNSGTVEEYDIKPAYVDDIKNRFSYGGEGRKVLVDCANGAACEISPMLLRDFGFDVVSVNDVFDGNFPNRLPEPIDDNLKETCERVKQEGVFVGFCHDGDADRMVPVDDKGRLCDLDKFIAFLAKMSVEETGIKRVVTTVETSMALDNYVGNDVEVVRTRVGDYAVAEELHNNGGCIGVEPAGAVLFPEFGLWPDGVYSIFRLLYFLEKDGRSLSEIMDSIPKFPFKRIKLDCPDDKKESVMNKVKGQVPGDVEVSHIDGIRMTWPESWLLVRPSGTEPCIRITAEGKTDEALNGMIDYWQNVVEGIIKNG